MRHSFLCFKNVKTDISPVYKIGSKNMMGMKVT